MNIRKLNIAFGKAFLIFFSFCLICFFSCRHEGGKETTEEKADPVTPVKVVNPEMGSISDFLELNATSSFLRKEMVKSTSNGYVSDIKISMGDMVHKGQTLFTIQTKEARALGDYKNTYDSSLHFSGIIPVLANKDGIVGNISHQKGDYVQDGEQLAIIDEQSSLVFLIDAPYEYHKYMAKNKSCTIQLPDGDKIPGTILSDLPMMDLNSQTQNYVVRPGGNLRMPEGLVARVRIMRTEKTNVLTLPKAAVLADEKEENFWVMKLINDSTAVKIPVKPGLQNDEKQEIASPKLDLSDRILASGNYGLNDTAKVKIIK